MKILLLDTETTGLKNAQICQLSYIIFDPTLKKAIGRNFYLKVDRMEAGAEKVHGLSMEKLDILSEGKRFADVAEQFLNEARLCDIIVAHNIKFDIERIQEEYRRLGIDIGDAFSMSKRFCTMMYYTNICKIPNPRNPKQYKFPKVEEVMAFLRIDNETVVYQAKEIFGECQGFHDARFDITATLKLLLEGFVNGYIRKGYFSDRLKPQEVMY